MDGLPITGTLHALDLARPHTGEKAERRSPLRPPELDDPAWLRRRYEKDGDMSIALDLGVDRKTVRAARARLGIGSAPPGRRRGVPLQQLTVNCPPSEALLAERIRAAQEAKIAGDKLAYEDAMLGVSAIAGRIVEHSRMLRRAA